MKYLTAPLALSALLALGGCAASPREAQVPEVREVRRADAVATARHDATRRYGEGWTAPSGAQYSSGFWVVDLRAPSGAGLHYAISVRDGTIRERTQRP